jgi:hypothetical protein
MKTNVSVVGVIFPVAQVKKILHEEAKKFSIDIQNDNN